MAEPKSQRALRLQFECLYDRYAREKLAQVGEEQALWSSFALVGGSDRPAGQRGRTWPPEKRQPRWERFSSLRAPVPYSHAEFVRGRTLCSPRRICNTLYDIINPFSLRHSSLITTPVERNYPDKIEVIFCVRGAKPPPWVCVGLRRNFLIRGLFC